MNRLICSAALAAATTVLSGTFTNAENNGLARVPYLGWNTWCAIGTCGTDYCYEDEIKTIAQAMVANGMRDLGYTLIHFDDCWGYPRNETTGEYQWDPERFPNGIPALVQYLNNLGFNLGVYTDSGIYTCSTGGRTFKIPGSYGHYEQDAATFESWGVRAVKMDWCNTNINGTQLDPRNVYPNMSKAINDTGTPMLFNSCEWGVDQPWTWASPWMNSWRIGGDHHDTWKGNSAPATEGVIESFAGLSQYAGPGGWNDGDMIYTGGQGCPNQQELGAHCPGQTDTEYMTEFTMWTIAAAPIVVATNVANMTGIMKTVLLNADMIAVHQDPMAVAGDRVAFTTDPGCPTNYCQVWTKPLASGDWAVVLYNRDDAAHNITLDFSVVTSSWKDQSVQFYDLWQHQYISGSFQSQFVAPVEGHGVVAVHGHVVSKK